MHVYDVIMLGVLLVATMFGASKGMAWQLASLSSIFLSYFAAFQLRGPVAEHINAAPPWNMFLAMLIVYLIASIVIWMVFQFVAGFIERLKLKDFDRQVGAIFGAAKGVVLCVLITLFAMTLLGENQRGAIVHSRSGRYIAMLLDRAHMMMPEEVHDVLHPYLHSLDEQIEHDHIEHDHIEGPEHHTAAEESAQRL